MSESVSVVYTIVAPALVGVWVFDPTDPDGTERNYIHADGRSETIKPKGASIEVAGRTNPILEFGEVTIVGLKLTVFVPFGDDHDVAVQWWRDACENRRAINYRDNRGRLYWVGLPDGVEAVDGRAGTAFSLTLQRVDFDEAVA